MSATSAITAHICSIGVPDLLHNPGTSITLPALQLTDKNCSGNA